MYRMSDFDRPEITGTEGVSDYVEADDVLTAEGENMRDYYNGGGNGMSCLGSGWSSSDGVTSNVADSGAAVTPSPVYPSSNTPSPVYTPSPVATSASGDCVHI